MEHWQSFCLPHPPGYFADSSGSLDTAVNGSDPAVFAGCSRRRKISYSVTRCWGLGSRQRAAQPLLHWCCETPPCALIRSLWKEIAIELFCCDSLGCCCWTRQEIASGRKACYFVWVMLDKQGLVWAWTTLVQLWLYWKKRKLCYMGRFKI